MDNTVLNIILFNSLNRGLHHLLKASLMQLHELLGSQEFELPLQLGEDQFNGVELWTIGHVEDELYLQLHGLRHYYLGPMDGQVVQEERQGLQRVHVTELLEVDAELVGVDRPFEDLPVFDSFFHGDAHHQRQGRLIELVLVNGDVFMPTGVLRPRNGGPGEHRLVRVYHTAAGLEGKPQLLHHLHLPYYGILHLFRVSRPFGNVWPFS